MVLESWVSNQNQFDQEQNPGFLEKSQYMRVRNGRVEIINDKRTAKQKYNDDIKKEILRDVDRVIDKLERVGTFVTTEDERIMSMFGTRNLEELKKKREELANNA